MKSFTVEQFESNFDELFSRVEDGESFIITSKSGNVVITPYTEVATVVKENGVDEELIRIHTDHEEGS